jgi:hypothetical protein
VKQVVSPTFAVSHEQARAILAVGQRLTDLTTSVPVHDDLVAVGFCDEDFVGMAGRSWYSQDSVPEPDAGLPAGLSGGDSTRVGATFTAIVVLDASPSAGPAVDARIRGWSTCQPKEGGALTTRQVHVPGAAASVVRTSASKGVSPWRAHTAEGVARVANVLVSCATDARTPQLALATTTSCLTEMVAATPMVAGQEVDMTQPNRRVAAKAILAQLPTAAQTVTVDARGASTPCATSSKAFLPEETPHARLMAKDQANFFGSVQAMRVADAAAAKAMVSTARTTFGGCRGSYQQGREPYLITGKITGVSPAALGDGGFTIARTRRLGGVAVERIEDSIFSVGPYVVQVSAAKPREARAIAARLTVLAAS